MSIQTNPIKPNQTNQICHRLRFLQLYSENNRHVSDFMSINNCQKHFSFLFNGRSTLCDLKLKALSKMEKSAQVHESETIISESVVSSCKSTPKIEVDIPTETVYPSSISIDALMKAWTAC